MKIASLFIALALFIQPHAQTLTIDTIKKIAAYTSNYMPLPVFGKSNNGHIYTGGLNNNYAANGVALPMEILRIDLTTGKVTRKTLEGSGSSSSAVWQYVFDSLGNFYLGLNSNNRKIFSFNFKDSIYYENLGNGFPDGNTLAYSMALGLDKHVYFGGSSGRTYWTEYDPYSEKITTHPPADSSSDYVLSIQGDANYVYCQTGQRKAINFWAIRKADNSKKLLFQISNTKRFNTSTSSDGYCYVSLNTDTLSGVFRLKDGIAIPIQNLTSKPGIQYSEVNGGNNQTSVVTNFDAVQGKLFYSLNNGEYKSIAMYSSRTLINIRAVFGFKNDPGNIYYAGDYYGNYYRYNVNTDSAYLLGSTGYNVYATLEENDSIMWMSGYPSGYIMQWNSNKPWTTQKFLNGHVTDAYKDRDANPKLLKYFKSNTAAGFHHASLLAFDMYGNIVSAGNVIRIGNTASVGVFAPRRDSIYGYDFNKMKQLGAAGLASWRDQIVFSTNNSFGGKPKLYFYNSRLNTMTDSLDLGFADYGKIYIKDNILTGISGNRIYQADLSSKKLIQNYSFPANSITGSYMLSNGVITINTKNELPKTVPGLMKLPYMICYENNGILYAISGKYILRINPQKN